jgi:GNAT superfamily N-acetyltransferase
MSDAPLEPHGQSIVLRRPTEDDQPRIAQRVDHWFGGRRVWPLVGRTWFRHFAGTSLLAEDANGAPMGFLLGFLSPDRPDEAALHLVAVEPNHRRQGLGRRIVDARGRRHRRPAIRAVAWPGRSARRPLLPGDRLPGEEGPGSMNLYGVPAGPTTSSTARIRRSSSARCSPG